MEKSRRLTAEELAEQELLNPGYTATNGRYGEIELTPKGYSTSEQAKIVERDRKARVQQMGVRTEVLAELEDSVA